MNGMEKAYLYWNTVKHLKPVQIKHQIENRVYRDRRKKNMDYVNELPVPKKRTAIRILIPELDCEACYLERFSVDRMMLGMVEFLHEAHRVGKEWNVPEASRLWNYNLHYLEFLIPLAVQYTSTGKDAYFFKWKELIEGWLGQCFGGSLEPYPISMRIPNLLICMELLREKINGTELEEKLFGSVYRQYRYLLLAQEKALLANHYFENLKAIVISSLLFGELDIYHNYFVLFLKEIEEQILNDGLHFERSLMYHKVILEDILRVYLVLNSVQRMGDAQKLIPTICMMASAMVCLEQGFERTPLFNDAGNNVSKDKNALLRAIERNCRDSKDICNSVWEKEKGKRAMAVCSFKASGYYKLYYDETALFFDCGEIGPPYMGGHAHNDCLSFELCVKGSPLFVNSGTGQYQGGLRPFFRSAAAHNTVMIDSREQSELWGEHRAARRIRKVQGAVRGGALIGQFQSFLGDSFRRSIKWKKGNGNVLVIRDDIKACDTGRHMARQFFHLAPGYYYIRDGKQVKIVEGRSLKAVVKLPEECDYMIHRDGLLSNYAEDFGEYRKKEVLEIRTPFESEVCLKTEIDIFRR